MKAKQTVQPARHLLRYERTWIALAAAALGIWLLSLFDPVIVRSYMYTDFGASCLLYIHNRITGSTQYVLITPEGGKIFTDRHTERKRVTLEE